MNFTKSATTVALVVAGVFIAGMVMNALRDNDFVKNAINGFDG